MFKYSNMAENDTAPVSMIDTCNGCGICRKECAFLATHGNPGAIGRLYGTDPDKCLALSFECSLCGLCTSVCPKKFDPSAMFLDFRREAFKRGQADFPEHRGLLNYERRGTSKKYTFYSVPENCNAVFFPGCTLTGTRPENTLKTYEYLEKKYENLGVVLDCCTKPSHDLGRQLYFQDMFSEMKSFLLESGIETIIVACPNCYKIFNTYAEEFEVETVYEVMARCGLDEASVVSGNITVHDPCPVRFEKNIHESVRSIVKARGLEVIETPHQKSKTLCCGEGGAVGCISPGYARAWTEKRVCETQSEKLVSYCAGCVNLLSGKAQAVHVLDLVFDPEKAMSGKARVSRAPLTYWNRLNIKRRLKKAPAGTIRERSFTALEEKEKNPGFNKLKLLVAVLILVCLIVFVNTVLFS